MVYWYSMRTIRLCFSLAVLLAVSGCAIQKKQAPQIASATADALNFATLVSNAQNDYQIFFETVGTLEKQHALTPEQVGTLNAAGLKIRDALDLAGSAAQTYAATNSQTVADQITQYLSAAAAAYAQLYAERASMLSQNAAAAAKVSSPK